MLYEVITVDIDLTPKAFEKSVTQETKVFN